MRSLADRMKGYEETFHHVAVRRMPVMIRVDGRAFHSLGLNKPFDNFFMDAMIDTARDVAQGMQGFKVAYVQSDEISFALTDYDTHATQGWFDYDVAKMVSISAAHTSVAFNRNCPYQVFAMFDSRVFSIPEDDVANAFLWRANRAHFSHKELHGKRRADMHEMLYDKGLNWATHLSDRERNGVFLINGAEGIQVRCDIRANYQEINEAVGHLFERPTEEAE